MKVGPCISASLGSSDQNASNTLSRAIVTASGSVPPVSAFDSVMMSGTTPAASQANMLPVRPKPVKISSKIKHELDSGRPPRAGVAAPAPS